MTFPWRASLLGPTRIPQRGGLPPHSARLARRHHRRTFLTRLKSAPLGELMQNERIVSARFPGPGARSLPPAIRGGMSPLGLVSAARGTTTLPIDFRATFRIPSWLRPRHPPSRSWERYAFPRNAFKKCCLIFGLLWKPLAIETAASHMTSPWIRSTRG